MATNKDTTATPLSPEEQAEQRRVYFQNYRARHKAVIAEKRRVYYQTHKAILLVKQQERDAVRMATEPEKVRAVRRAYAQANREKINGRHRAAAKARRRADPAKYRDKDRIKRAKNLEAIRTRDRAIKRAMPTEKRRADYQQWAQKNPEQLRLNWARRRAREQNAPTNDLTVAQWKEIKDSYDGCCAYCGRRMQRLTMDHITPLAKGGSHTASNILPACLRCNLRKYTGPVPTPVQPMLLTAAPAKRRKHG